jgi:trk system potassium uptake protein TrkH
MIDPRPIFLVIGTLLTTLAATMLLPALADLAAGEDGWVVFIGSAAITGFVGVAMALSTWGTAGRMTIRQAFILTSAAWTAIAAFGALPLYFSDIGLDYASAFFEAMSGVTTTGSTTIVGLDDLSPGLLLWRGLLQWLGGLGIIVMAIAVLPMLQIGGMQLFRVEAFELQERTHARAVQMSASLTAIYIGLTVACGVSYAAVGLGPFDAAVHAMTTIATGGFSNYDASLGHFRSTAVEMVCIVFMIFGSLPFLLYARVLQGRIAALFRDTQVRWFFASIAIFTALAVVSIGESEEHIQNGLREALFNIVSIMTGTGFSTVDYDNWGPLAMVLFFVVTFVGGCAGSTSCGIKIFRFQILFEHMRVQLSRISFPHGVFTMHYHGRPIAEQVSASVMTFFFLFFLSFFVLASLLSAVGLDNVTALSGAGTALANVGPGLGPIIGPAGNFATLPDSAKWLLSAGMLMGRLELFTVLVLFLPAFWRT